jgi:hypothetical protein
MNTLTRYNSIEGANHLLGQAGFKYIGDSSTHKAEAVPVGDFSSVVNANGNAAFTFNKNVQDIFITGDKFIVSNSENYNGVHTIFTVIGQIVVTSSTVYIDDDSGRWLYDNKNNADIYHPDLNVFNSIQILNNNSTPSDIVLKDTYNKELTILGSWIPDLIGVIIPGAWIEIEASSNKILGYIG